MEYCYSTVSWTSKLVSDHHEYSVKRAPKGKYYCKIIYLIELFIYVREFQQCVCVEQEGNEMMVSLITLVAGL